MDNSEVYFKSLGNISRVKILACIGESPKSVSALIKQCGLSQSAVSQHLMHLRDANLIKSTKDGRNRIYKSADPELSSICKLIINNFSKWQQ